MSSMFHQTKVTWRQIGYYWSYSNFKKQLALKGYKEMSILASASAHVGTAVHAVVPAAYQNIMNAWTPSEDVSKWGRWIAAGLLAFWVLHIIFKMVTPKKGGARQINWVGLGMSGMASLLLMNLGLIPTIVNNVGLLFYSLGDFLFNGGNGGSGGTTSKAV